FLKRFESSVVAFEASCQTLLLKLLAFLRVNIDSDAADEVERLEKWQVKNADILDHVKERRGELVEEEGSEESDLGDEFLGEFEKLSRKDYRINEILDDTYHDLDTIVDFLKELRSLGPEHDDKLQTLVNLLTKDRVLRKQKVIVFTEFMSTARYLRKQLTTAGIEGVDEVDSASKRDRADVIQDFAPYYNDSSSARLAEQNRKEIRVLVSTDVLSEGLNLQDATRLINYDLHWNPVKLMQRIGRVDRRLNPAVEDAICSEHPELAADRGHIRIFNFLPPDDLDRLLKL